MWFLRAIGIASGTVIGLNVGLLVVALGAHEIAKKLTEKPKKKFMFF